MKQQQTQNQNDCGVDLEGGTALKERVGGQSRQAVSDSPSSGRVGCDASASAQRGKCNTPAAEQPLIPVGSATCIDYIKIRFTGEFKPKNHPDWPYIEVFQALLLDPEDFEARHGLSGYRHGFQYSEFTNVYAGGNATKTAGDLETWILEMTGQGCREFEDRVLDQMPADHFRDPKETAKIEKAALHEGWRKFLKAIIACGGIATRIDIPTDDTSGIIPLEELKVKIAQHAFVSSMRSLKIDTSSDHPEEVPANEFDAPAHYQTSNKGGWTATLGTRESFQICIYNKKAEVEKHHPDWFVGSESWVRYEVRFYKKQARNCLYQLHEAYEKGPEAVHRFIVGCLATLLEIKEKAVSSNHMSRIPTWSKWQKFIACASEVKLEPPVGQETTLKTNALWLKDDGSRCIFRLSVAHPNKLRSIFLYLIIHGMTSCDKTDLFKVNNYLKAAGLKPYEDEAEMIRSLNHHFNLSQPIDEEIQKLFDDSIMPGNETEVKPNAGVLPSE